MAITKFRTATVDSGSSATVDFGAPVINSAVSVQGFEVSYGDKDHYVRTVKVETSISSTSGSTVSVSATCYMDDKSNNKANGKVNLLVISECES